MRTLPWLGKKRGNRYVNVVHHEIYDARIYAKLGIALKLRMSAEGNQRITSRLGGRGVIRPRLSVVV